MESKVDQNFSGAVSAIFISKYPHLAFHSTHKNPKKVLHKTMRKHRKEVFNPGIEFELSFQDSVQQNSCQANLFETIQGAQADCFQLMGFVRASFAFGMISKLEYLDFQIQVLELVKRLEKTAT